MACAGAEWGLEGFGAEIFTSESSGCWRLNPKTASSQAASPYSSRTSVLCFRTGSVLEQISLKKHTARWGSACQQLLRVQVTRRCGLDSILQCRTGPERRRCEASLLDLRIKQGRTQKMCC